jgi:hypothetical protein
VSLSDIRIRRFSDHPHRWQGAIEPEDRRWQLCVDEEGVPHLFLRIFAEVDGERRAGLVDYEQFVEVKIADLLDGEAGPEGEVSEEDAHAEWERLQAEGYRCPA